MPATVKFETDSNGVLRIELSGNWKLTAGIPDVQELARRIDGAADLTRIAFDVRTLEGWDSSLLAYVFQVREAADKHGLDLDCSELPPGVQGLMKLSGEPARTEEPSKDSQADRTILALLGDRWLRFWQAFLEVLALIGETTISFIRVLLRPSRIRGRDLWQLIQECGAQALPIVSLISVLVGLILAFVGAVQLQMFGAQIYIADLVGIAMTREMGAMMAAVIMAGRTGAAFAAQLGTMQVNEEIDALRTLGVSPIDFLVVPRMMALVLMMPFLCVYADVMGIAGGMLVGVGPFGINAVQYWNHTVDAVAMTHLFIGIGKSLAFGAIVALCGCLRGMQCGRSAHDVGAAATSAVVTAIVWIVVADGIFAVMCDAMGI